MSSRQEKVAFAHGVLAALAHIASRDDEVCWQEIVAANGGYDYLRGVSKRAGNIDFDGFKRYKKSVPWHVPTAQRSGE